MNSQNVMGFKLTNGLDLIAKLEESDENGFDLVDAFFLQTVRQQNGDINVEYSPITVLAKPSGKSHMGFDFTLPRNSVLFKYELNPGIVDSYMQYVSPIDLSMAPSVR
jgi:hypothetical protein